MSNFILEIKDYHYLRLDHVMFIYDNPDCGDMRLNLVTGQECYIKDEDIKKKIRAYFITI